MDLMGLVSHLSVTLEGRAALEATVRFGQRHLGSAKWEPGPGSEAAAELSNTEVRQGGDPWGEDPPRTAYAAANLMMTAVLDNLASIHNLLGIEMPAIGLTVVARSAIEIASGAWWLMEPGIGARRRVCRELALSLGSARSAKQFAGEFQALGVQAGQDVTDALWQEVEQVTLREQSEALEALAASLESLSPASRVDAAADTIAVARESGLTLWCDDIALRQKARPAGVQTLSLLDLITAMERNGSTIDQPALFRRLAVEYVMDLPLTADDITAIAAVGDWDRGPAHTALARPEWWQDQEDGWTSPWLRIAAEACKHSAAVFLDITKAALFGSTASVSLGQRTRRYQQLVVFALIACHDVGKQPPANLLAELAKAAGPGIAAPRPQYVLHALIAELEKQSPQDAVEISQSLLPASISSDARCNHRRRRSRGRGWFSDAEPLPSTDGSV